MRLGRIAADFSCVVDLDNPDMVAHAKDAIHEDVMSAVKHNEVLAWIKEVPTRVEDMEEDIPEFLLDSE